MDIKQLEYFVRVAELGSFTKAALSLQIAQSALSRQVRSLEIELRQSLFDRNGRGVVLTAAGKRLVAHGQGILQQVERARHDLMDRHGEPTGHLTVGLPPSIGRTMTSPLVGAFQAQFPGATLTIIEGLSAYLLEWLSIGRVDLAIVYAGGWSPAIKMSLLRDEPLFLISSRKAKLGLVKANKPVTLIDVAQQPLVIPSRPHAIRMLLETALAGIGRKSKIVVEIDSIPSILELVECGMGCAVLGDSAVQGANRAAFDIRPIRKSNLFAQLWLATSAQRPESTLVVHTAALVRELMKAT